MRPKSVAAAFELDLTVLPLTALLPLRQVSDVVKQSVKYRCIAQSIDEVGLVEPLVVYRQAQRHGKHLLLDGHLRRCILLDKGETETECLFARDDEAFTYNKRISRLAVVQEHFMIMRAIERGVSEAKLAKALNVKIEYVKRRSKMLKGISPEVVVLLRDKSVNPVTFDVLRKMQPARQIVAGELMASASNYSSAYAKALLAATKDADRVKPARPKPRIVTSADLKLMDRELKSVQQDLKIVEASYGHDMLNLVIAARYVLQIIGNPRIAHYLVENHPEVLREFRAITSTALPTHDAVEAL
jgi:ParB-like chromosome segregation protein Spo0J